MAKIKTGKIDKEKAKEIAQWMLEQFEGFGGRLSQSVAAGRIRQEFGNEFIFVNPNGNWGIHPKILSEFNKITPDVVWMRSCQTWRNRMPHDPEGKRMVY